MVVPSPPPDQPSDIGQDDRPGYGPPIKPPNQPALDTAWGVFGSTFATILLAELGDKTQITILLMSAEFHQPILIFMGASLALITTSLLGVLAGRWLAQHLSPRTLNRGAGLMLLAIALVLCWDIWSGLGS